MPSSHFYQLNKIIELITFTDPLTLLDIGVGFGKYGVLAREYLELWEGETKEFGKWKRIIDGIEVFPDYITPLHRFVYNKIYIGDALEIIPKLKKNYDLALLIDVVEHFEYKDGIKLIEETLKRSKNIIISTPKNTLLRQRYITILLRSIDRYGKRGNLKGSKIVSSYQTNILLSVI